MITKPYLSYFNILLNFFYAIYKVFYVLYICIIYTILIVISYYYNNHILVTHVGYRNKELLIFIEIVLFRFWNNSILKIFHCCYQSLNFSCNLQNWKFKKLEIDSFRVVIFNFLFVFNDDILDRFI